jgi:hypothetical protein
MYTFSFFVRRIEIENRLVIKKLFGGIYHNIQVLWHHFMADFE